MPTRSRYYKYSVKTKSGKNKTGIYRATSVRTATNGVSHLNKNAQKVHVFKTHPTKLK